MNELGFWHSSTVWQQIAIERSSDENAIYRECKDNTYHYGVTLDTCRTDIMTVVCIMIEQSMSIDGQPQKKQTTFMAISNL